MKALEWFTEWTTSFEKKNDERWEQQLEFNKLLLSLPTIKKEVEDLKR